MDLDTQTEGSDESLPDLLPSHDVAARTVYPAQEAAYGNIPPQIRFKTGESKCSNYTDIRNTVCAPEDSQLTTSEAFHTEIETESPGKSLVSRIKARNKPEEMNDKANNKGYAHSQRLILKFQTTYPPASFAHALGNPKWSLSRISDSRPRFGCKLRPIEYAAEYRLSDGKIATTCSPWYTFDELNFPWGIYQLRIFHRRNLFKPKDARIDDSNLIEWTGRREEWFVGKDIWEQERDLIATYRLARELEVERIPCQSSSDNLQRDDSTKTVDVRSSPASLHHIYDVNIDDSKMPDSQQDEEVSATRQYSFSNGVTAAYPSKYMIISDGPNSLVLNNNDDKKFPQSSGVPLTDFEIGGKGKSSQESLRAKLYAVAARVSPPSILQKLSGRHPALSTAKWYVRAQKNDEKITTSSLPSRNIKHAISKLVMNIKKGGKESSRTENNGSRNSKSLCSFKIPENDVESSHDHQHEKDSTSSKRDRELVETRKGDAKRPRIRITCQMQHNTPEAEQH